MKGSNEMSIDPRCACPLCLERSPGWIVGLYQLWLKCDGCRVRWAVGDHARNGWEWARALAEQAPDESQPWYAEYRAVPGLDRWGHLSPVSLYTVPSGDKGTGHPLS